MADARWLSHGWSVTAVANTKQERCWDSDAQHPKLLRSSVFVASKICLRTWNQTVIDVLNTIEMLQYVLQPGGWMKEMTRQDKKVFITWVEILPLANTRAFTCQSSCICSNSAWGHFYLQNDIFFDNKLTNKQTENPSCRLPVMHLGSTSGLCPCSGQQWRTLKTVSERIIAETSQAFFFFLLVLHLESHVVQ